MAANEKIVFDGDPEPLVRANKKSQEEIKKTRKEARTLTQEVETMGKSWLKSVIGITAAAAAVRALVNAGKELRADKESLSKTRGASAIGISVALAGRSKQDIGAVTTAAENAQDPEAAAKFIAGLSGNRKAKRISAQQMQAFATAAGSGLFTDAELQAGVKRGVAPDVNKRLNQLSDSARAEYNIRQKEREAQPFQFMGSSDEDRERSALWERKKSESIMKRGMSAVSFGLTDEIGRALTETGEERARGTAEDIYWNEKARQVRGEGMQGILVRMRNPPQVINANGER